MGVWVPTDERTPVAYIVMAHKVMAYIVMAYIVMVDIVVVDIVMTWDTHRQAKTVRLYSYGLHSYDLYSDGLYSYDLGHPQTSDHRSPI